MKRFIIKVKNKGAADHILNFLRIPHVREVIARSPEELLVKYTITARRNMEIGYHQDNQIQNIGQLIRRAAFSGCPFSPDETLAYLFDSETDPHDAACLLLWIREKEYIKDIDIVQLLK